MNANEVIATLAGDGAHPNDHVNMGQSSNDVFPSAVHLAALDEATNTLLPALEQLERSFARKARRFDDVVKSGRTHLMDAVPVTLGQEFAGYAAQIRLGPRAHRGRARARRPDPARRHRDRHRPQHPPEVRRARAQAAASARPSSSRSPPPADPFEAQANRDALVELSGALKVVAVSLTKIAHDLALMGSGPRAGIGEIFLPELQKGSSIMPGKVNPVLPEVVLQVGAQVIGNDTAITIGGMQGQFELNVRIPLIARNLLQSIHLLSTTAHRVRREVRRRHRGQQGGLQALGRGDARRRPPRSTSTSATTRATAIVKKAADSGRTLREVALERGRRRRALRRVIDLRRSHRARAARRRASNGPGTPASRASAARLRAPSVGEQALLVDARAAGRCRGTCRRIEPPAKVGRSAKSCRFQTSIPSSHGSAP